MAKYNMKDDDARNHNQITLTSFMVGDNDKKEDISDFDKEGNQNFSSEYGSCNECKSK